MVRGPVLAAALAATVALASCNHSGSEPDDAGSSTSAPATTAADPPTTTTPPTTAVPANPNATGEFRIVGRHIVDPDGKVFVPMGANVAVRQGGREYGYTFNWRGTATDRSDDVLAWGWNAVRANVICIAPGGNAPTQEEIHEGIDAFIDEYTAKRIVVIVECHDATGSNPDPSHPIVEGVYAFMERLAHKYGDNPYVWFNVFNEPYDGQTAADVEAWLELQRDALGRIRAIAPRSVFVADIPGHGQGVDTFAGEAPITRLGDGQCNVLYDWHPWGAVGENGTFGVEVDRWDADRSAAAHARVLRYLADNDIPVVLAEFGDPLEPVGGTAGPPTWNRNAATAVMDLAPGFGVGLLWWHATGDSSVYLTYSLTADRSAPWEAATTGEGLTPSGRRFWEISRSRPGGQRFEGDVSASNC